ncbi:hypothetical protein AMATHDRAFT_44659 [Amanita thiersii Skay4041]|uniref:Uncharacterized protein n=1 Tax=Amanita thiersii Skay4041 TaxID=703135 RepID=A0A2A9P1X4_9AGAR|nr:hypothetical protein AMATHDRAFT_44659 [Amanita thiersii Skay4041]
MADSTRSIHFLHADSLSPPPSPVRSSYNPSHARGHRDPLLLKSRRVSAPVYMNRPSLSTSTSTRDTDSVPGVFSDEYDLYPRILQDVQRALNLKAKREALLRNRPPRVDSNMPSLSASSSSARPRYDFLPPRTSNRNTRLAISSDIDFGPAVGSTSFASTSTSQHPVPSSLDNGITLDWSGAHSDHDKAEKRWPLSLKRKGKEALPHLNIIAQQQEQVHNERLERVRREAGRNTLQKAAITSDQLSRRYQLLHSSLSSPFFPLNPVTIARWYETQELNFKTSLGQKEPATWLKHLQKRRRNPAARSPWFLTALVVEEYIRGEMPTSATSIIEAASANASPRRSFSPTPALALNPPYSRGSPHSSLVLSLEGPVSFEPHTRSARESLDILSRKSGESGYSSAGSKSSNVLDTRQPGSKRWQEDLSTRLYRKLARETEGVMSGRTSLSEISERGMTGDIVLDADGNHNVNEKESLHGPDIKFIITHEPPSEEALPVFEVIQAQDANEGSQLQLSPNRSPPSDTTQGNVTPVNRLAPWIEKKRRKRVNQERLRREYEEKSRLLEEATAQNHRIRQLLNRVSIVVKEYEMARSNALASLGKHQHQGIPREVLEAFNHDPATVTGHTRRHRGWNAVDDIHNRLLKQRETLRQFLSDQAQSARVQAQVMLREPAKILTDALGSLENCKNIVQSKALDVAEMLKKVQEVHSAVKANYNRALSHTSAVYPELSLIVTLEESYQDQYQQVWEFGMDALTFILDSVTPFWRTYGKTIGDDIRDFLIIPLYRNEFTGEAKRYPITGVPKRSLRHWMSLCLFISVSMTLTLLQIRGAITSIIHSGLRCLPYESLRWTLLPFFWILIVIQWSLVMTELAIVLMELAVLLWWTGWSVKLLT